ncbi:hypothetical protein DFJ74DRAFT_697595 [Hyaloraphidium curvatum]|nr:hypothetical protein DFJ74DRAFT_697595 [Hyaloraphidium curvatum]
MLIAAVFLCLVAGAAAQCRKTHPFVGFRGALRTLEPADNMAGTVEVLDDCTFLWSEATLRRGVPAVFWYGSATSDAPSVRRGGRVSNEQVPASGLDGQQTLTYTLTGNRTWDDGISVLSGWCESFSAHLAVVELQRAPTTSAVPAATPSSAAPSPSSAQIPTVTPKFESCVTLSDGVYNLHWTVNSDGTITIAQEIAAAAMTWSGFGVPDPSGSGGMVNASVVITGEHDSAGFFATNYHLFDRSQCSYNVQGATDGVCPYSEQGTDLRMLGSNYDRSAGVRMVWYSRSLRGSGKDWPIVLGREVPVIWAFGPLSESSERPVVLYHGQNHSPTNVTIRFDRQQNNCKPLGAAAPTSSARNETVLRVPASSPTIVVTVGPNPSYPNPPGWGISYHLNGVESPHLVLDAGADYVFSVQAGPTHPLYITDSALGGRGRIDDPMAIKPERVVAGEFGFANGTAAAPGILRFRADPALQRAGQLYYQCYSHQKLGWKLTVRETDASTGGNAATTAAASMTPTGATPTTSSRPSSADMSWGTHGAAWILAVMAASCLT